MFGLINREIKKVKVQSGQVAIVLLLIVALALIFYAASLNFGRISQTKTLTMVAANTSASQMASSMASYGQQSWQSTLGGRIKDDIPKYCDSSNILVTIITLGLLIIILIIITILCWGTCAGVVWPLGIQAGVVWAGVALSVVLTAATLTLQVTVIQPAMIHSWNKIQKNALSTPDQFLEAAISSALQSTVTDTQQVPDLFDVDQDSLYVGDANGSEDEINRYTVYYNERMKTIKRANFEVVKFFLDELKELVFEEEDEWGLYDNTEFLCKTAECNKCCVPQFVDGRVDDEGNPLPVRSEECGEVDVNGTPWEEACAAMSPYGASYPFVYQAHYEDPTNEFLSFREFLGKDDETNALKTDTTQIPFDPLTAPQISEQAGEDDFRMADASGFYRDPPYMASADFVLDPREGVFPALHKTQKWTYALGEANPVSNETDCHWCDARGSPACSDYADHPLELGQLVLPIDPNDVELDNQNPCVDQNTDAVVAPQKIGASPGACVGNPFLEEDPDDATTIKGFWKPGNDNLCSTEWPYSEQCPKHGGDKEECQIILDVDEKGNPVDTEPTDCMCQEAGANPSQWNDDALDDLVKGIPQIVNFIDSVKSIGAVHLVHAFDQWYPEAAKWIEPLAQVGDNGKNFIDTDGNKAKCFECQGLDKVYKDDKWTGKLTGTREPGTEEGVFYTWRRNVKKVKDRLEEWLGYEFIKDEITGDAGFVGLGVDRFQGYGSSGAWCFPDTKGMAKGEVDTIDANENGTEKDVGDVVACLDWNINDEKTFIDPGSGEAVSARGNAEKFALCANRCDADSCLDLPRSEVDFGGVIFTPDDAQDEADIRALLRCFNNCNNQLCQAMPKEDKDGNAFFDIDPEMVDFEAACQSPTQLENVWENKVIEAIRSISENEQCVPGVDSSGGTTFRTLVKKAAFEAENQVVKFEHRKRFLENRKNEFEEIVKGLFEAETRLGSFLDCDICEEDDIGPDPDNPICLKGKPKGAACALVQDRIDYEGKKDGLPYQAIYGWKSDTTDEQKAKGQQGRWHLVRADARLPGRCDKACHDEGQRKKREHKKFPWVKAKKSGFLGSTICYKLVDRDGVVKMRVTRWDEDTGSGSTFANKRSLWKIRSGNPGVQNSMTGSGGMETACEHLFLRKYPPPKNEEMPGLPYDGAFILNERIPNVGYDLTDIPEDERHLFKGNEACWDTANKLLSQGVMSETCAKYYWHYNDAGGVKQAGMSFKFIECKNF